jgi:hypothetical protein
MHMSRSRKRVPVASFPRLRFKLAILRCHDWDELVMPVIREVSDVWVMSKEDRHWITPRWSYYLGRWYPDEKELARIKRK